MPQSRLQEPVRVSPVEQTAARKCEQHKPQPYNYFSFAKLCFYVSCTSAINVIKLHALTLSTAGWCWWPELLHLSSHGRGRVDDGRGNGSSKQLWQSLFNVVNFELIRKEYWFPQSSVDAFRPHQLVSGRCAPSRCGVVPISIRFDFVFILLSSSYFWDH